MSDLVRHITLRGVALLLTPLWFLALYLGVSIEAQAANLQWLGISLFLVVYVGAVLVVYALHRSWLSAAVAFLFPAIALPILAFKGLDGVLTRERERRWADSLAAVDDAGTLIRALGDDQGGVREQAASRLRQMGPAAVRPLLEAVRNPDAGARARAARMLGELGWQPTPDDNGAAYWAAQGSWDKCIEIGAPAVEPLLLALRTGNWSQQPAIIQALGEIGDDRAIPPLTAALRDPGAAVPQAAAQALERLGVPAETIQSVVAGERQKAVTRSSVQMAAILTGIVLLIGGYVTLIVLVFSQPTIPLWAGTLMVAPTPIGLILARIQGRGLKQDSWAWKLGCGIALGLLPGGLLLLGLVWLFQREALLSFFQALFS